jgi:hypothetical protein
LGPSLSPACRGGGRYFLSDRTWWSSRPDARVTFGQFIPRVEAGRAPACPVGHGTDASGRCDVSTQWSREAREDNRTLWCIRSVMFGRVRSTKTLSGSSLYSTECHVVVRLVRQASASGQGAQQRECALIRSRVRVRSVLIGVSGHLSARVTSSLDHWRSCGSGLNAYTWQRSNGAARHDRTLCPRQVVLTCASGQPDSSRVKCLTTISCWGRLYILVGQP